MASTPLTGTYVDQEYVQLRALNKLLTLHITELGEKALADKAELEDMHYFAEAMATTSMETLGASAMMDNAECHRLRPALATAEERIKTLEDRIATLEAGHMEERIANLERTSNLEAENVRYTIPGIMHLYTL